MPETYSCTLPDCNKAFTRAFELKKHIKFHEDPSSVFYCSYCDFITLQRKNLGIHTAIHTGEKNIHCPHMIVTDGREERCGYRTNDPAALSKHRKKEHEYIPPPNRRRQRVTPTPPCRPYQKKEGKSPRRRQPAQCVNPSPLRKVFCAPGVPRRSASVVIIPCIRLEGEDGNGMNVDRVEDSGYESGSATLIGTEDDFGLDVLFDPSLRPDWMEKYEESYTTFDMTGMKRQLETLSGDSPFDPAALHARTGREGCLCPEWMVETGVDGWDESVIEAHKEYYVIHT